MVFRTCDLLWNDFVLLNTPVKRKNLLRLKSSLRRLIAIFIGLWTMILIPPRRLPLFSSLLLPFRTNFGFFQELRRRSFLAFFSKNLSFLGLLSSRLPPLSKRERSL